MLSMSEEELKNKAYELLDSKEIRQDDIIIGIKRTEVNDSGEKMYFCYFEYNFEYGEACFSKKTAEHYSNVRDIINIHEYLLTKEHEII